MLEEKRHPPVGGSRHRSKLTELGLDDPLGRTASRPQRGQHPVPAPAVCTTRPADDPTDEAGGSRTSRRPALAGAAGAGGPHRAGAVGPRRRDPRAPPWTSGRRRGWPRCSTAWARRGTTRTTHGALVRAGTGCVAPGDRGGHCAPRAGPSGTRPWPPVPVCPLLELARSGALGRRGWDPSRWACWGTGRRNPSARPPCWPATRWALALPGRYVRRRPTISFGPAQRVRHRCRAWPSWPGSPARGGRLVVV